MINYHSPPVLYVFPSTLFLSIPELTLTIEVSYFKMQYWLIHSFILFNKPKIEGLRFQGPWRLVGMFSESGWYGSLLNPVLEGEQWSLFTLDGKEMISNPWIGQVLS